MIGALRLAVWRFLRHLLQPLLQLWWRLHAGVKAGIAAALANPRARQDCAEGSNLDGAAPADLQRQLEEARARVTALEAACTHRFCSPSQSGHDDAAHRKPIRIFIDGAFDLMHFGHMNAFRQARALGDYLIVGVNSDSSVAECKGLPPVLNDRERQAAVSGCRFVDEIIPGSPYVMSEDYIQYLIDKYDVDVFVHGDDPCLVDGRDVYEAAKRAGRYRSIPRTEGISTTEIVGRMLLMTKEHHVESPTASVQIGSDSAAASDAHAKLECASEASSFLVTSQLMQLFCADLRKPDASPTRIVYADGAWDMFHAGHIDFLARARELGDFLIVGVHSDKAVNEHRGGNHPILSMQERVLGLLGCRHVDDVLLNAPWLVTREMIATLRIDVVARGLIRDCADAVDVSKPHEVPQSMGILVELDSGSSLTLEKIMERMTSRRDAMCERYKDKQKREEDFWRHKHSLN